MFARRTNFNSCAPGLRTGPDRTTVRACPRSAVVAYLPGLAIPLTIKEKVVSVLGSTPVPVHVRLDSLGKLLLTKATSTPSTKRCSSVVLKDPPPTMGVAAFSRECSPALKFTRNGMDSPLLHSPMTTAVFLFAAAGPAMQRANAATANVVTRSRFFISKPPCCCGNSRMLPGVAFAKSGAGVPAVSGSTMIVREGPSKPASGPCRGRAGRSGSDTGFTSIESRLRTVPAATGCGAVAGTGRAGARDGQHFEHSCDSSPTARAVACPRLAGSGSRRSWGAGLAGGKEWRSR